MSIRSLLLCCVLLFPCIASASPLSIQPSVSTLGVGVDISYRQNSFIAYRLSAFTQPFDTKIKLKGIQYKTEDSSHPPMSGKLSVLSNHVWMGQAERS